MKNPGGKYLIGFRKIKSFCENKKWHPGISTILCSHKKRNKGRYFCVESNCSIVKTLVEIRN